MKLLFAVTAIALLLGAAEVLKGWNGENVQAAIQSQPLTLASGD